ncbi:oligoendopeptidase, PepF/M3 family [Treponema primitia ZAS-2]|uniref:Oligoendopeptidase, PepF/M3 family n=1 Tax=Treponema primitia (strain ATCC BAA-887 / DSM 12427 / ZAS-2) TaxID=545694 RepID=F5YKM9_TREPZ|nr:M3 family oligoendopeptidase [Treponema primitia]AEF86649.1 oligoendopeptidase, PepF/M3 family [Treponema primitia ZAS-2]
MPSGIKTGDAQTEALPKWDLTTIYPSFDSPEYRRDLELLKGKIAAFLQLLGTPLPESGIAAALLALIGVYEEAGNLNENLSAYAEAIYTADTRDSRALAEINAIDAAALPLGKGAVIFRNRLAEAKDRVLKALDTEPALKPFDFFIRESLEKAAYQMSPELEDLANDLARSGGDAWGRLQEAVSSTATALWDRDTGERKTVIALRDLAHSPDRKVRERAYRAELEAWASMKIPLASSLNGVKGSSLTVGKRRGWKSILQKSAFQSRVSEKALGALIVAMEGSLPVFRRYLKTKASLLGLKSCAGNCVASCAFYDLFAPVGGITKKWTWTGATEFIIEQFGAFDPDMGAFARRAVDSSWIDALGREGKIGGAYCTDFPLAGHPGELPRGESRILCNFEGSFDSVFTVAHELGHAWHHELIKDLNRFQAAYPMTLAETASIFAETIIFEGALGNATDDHERVGLIEGNLKDCCQVIVDILSRFYFEQALFEQRENRELPAEELCALMIDAQKKTYGDGLDPEQLHPYMWAVKSHYYNPGLAFYNYPYAFGQLFSLGLFARAKKEGQGLAGGKTGFASGYRKMLRLTGQASAVDVAKSAGFDIEDGAFWQGGIALIAERVEEFVKLAKTL